MKTIIAIALTLALSACAAPPPMHYVSNSYAAGGISVGQAQDKCNYETSAATQSTDYSYRSMFGQELDRALRKRDLMEMCMKAQGFVLHI